MSNENNHIEKPGESEAQSAETASDTRSADAPNDARSTDADSTEPSTETQDHGQEKTVYRVDLPEVPMDEEALLKLLDDTNSPPEPTETYKHPVTGREVYVPKNSKALGPSALMTTASLLMFVGGALATAMMVARAFDIHGQMLLVFVISSSAFILSMAGGLLVKTLGDGDKWYIGAGVGACFGAMSAVLVYMRSSNHPWWQ
jgi:hypothetical protein